MSIQLIDSSIEIILKNQHPSGSYAACPCFDTYKYCWLRDGSFICHAMDIYAHHDSAGRFLDWVDSVLSRQVSRVKQLCEMAAAGQPLLNSEFLPARYNLDGTEVEDEWPNFQLDGYGTWLWALHEHIKVTGDTSLINKYSVSINLTVEYLTAFWRNPNYDCWEEHGDKVHPSTLACIYGGLKAINCYLNDVHIDDTIDKIKTYIMHNCVKDDRLVKHTGSDSVDASLLWLALPFGVFSAEDVIIQRTVKLIEEKLLSSGGIHRYPEDTYYGGGQWVLLSCWLGWYYAETGRVDEAVKLLMWAENQADPENQLPEQVLNEVNNPDYINKWKELWGQPAKPLLWSHGMYLVLCHVIDSKNWTNK